jgi:CHAT domain-containing protein
MRSFALAQLFTFLSAAGAAAQPPADAKLVALRAERDALWKEGRAQYGRMRYDLALDTAERVVKLSERLDGGKGADTADALEWQFEVLLHRQDYKDAIPIADRLVELRAADTARPWLLANARAFQRYNRRLVELGDDGVRAVLNTARDLQRAGRLHDVGKTDEAIRLTRAALAERKKLLGYEDHMYAEWLAVHSYHCLAVPELKDEAARAREDARRVIRELFGERHRHYAALLQGDALGHRQRGELDPAESLLARAADTFREVLGPTHTTSLKALELLASAQRDRAEAAIKKGDRTAAIGHYADEGRTWAKRYDGAHWRVKETDALAAESRFARDATAEQVKAFNAGLAELGRAHKLSDDGDRKAALPLAVAAHAAVAGAAGERHRAALAGLDLVAKLYARAEQTDKAEESHFRLVKATAAALGAEHPDSARRADALSAWLSRRLSDRLDDDDFAEAVRLAGKLAEAERLRYPTQPWRAKSHDATAAHIRAVAKLPAADRRKLAEADRLMAAAEDANAAQRFAAARDAADKAVRIRFDLLGDGDTETLDALHALGYAEGRLGNFAAAERYLRRALAGWEGVLGKGHSRYAFTLKELAANMSRAGYGERATEAMEEAATIIRDTLGRRHPQYTHTITGLASLYLDIGRTDRAAPLLTELEERLGDREAGRDDAQLYNTLGGLYDRARRPETALVMFEKAADLWKARKDRFNYAIGLDNVAGAYRVLGEYERAEPIAREAVELFRELLGDRHPTTARGWANLAAVYALKKDTPKALEFQKKAVRASRDNLALAADVGSESMQLSAFARARQALDVYVHLAERAGTPAAEVWAEVLAWKGAVFARQAFLREARADPALAGTAAELRRRSAELAELAFGAPGPKVAERIEELARERDRLEQKLAAATAGRAAPRPPTPDEVRAALPADAVLIDYFACSPPDVFGPPRLFAYIARRDRPPVRVDCGPLAAVETAVAAWRATFGPSGRGDPGTELRRLVWKPLESHLDGAGTLLVSPDGALSQVPFAALPGRAAGRYLIEDHPLVVVPTPQTLTRKLPPRAAPSLLAVGDVTFGPRPADGRRAVPPLPGTGAEADAVADGFARRFPKAAATALRGDAATKAAVLAAAPGRRYVHLATHGLFLDPSGSDREGRAADLDPLLATGVLFAGYNRAPAGAVLTALEAAELDLRGAELVVLSACDTGRGSVAGGEGVLGLQRAFQLAGADAVVVTLWAVDDGATQRLMGEFYRNLWDRKMSKAEALRAAQLRLLRGEEVGPEAALTGLAGGPAVALGRPRGVTRSDAPLDYRHPYYWAAFSLCSDGR